MAGTLQRREQGLRTFADHVTHELKSPLTTIKGAAELLEVPAGLPEADRLRLVRAIALASDRMQALLDGLRALAQAREPVVAGTATLAGVTEHLRQDHPGLSLRLSGADLILPVPANVLRMVLGHLLTNAAEHQATRVGLDAGSSDPLVLRISDDGAGISPGNLPHLFTPFFTTRREQGGTGMGLAISRSLLESAGATIEAEASAGGTAFVIRF